MVLLPQDFLASQEPLASLVLDEEVGSITLNEYINHDLTCFKLLPQVSLDSTLPRLEASLAVRNSPLQALTPLAVALLDSTLPLEDRRTFSALDGLGLHLF